MRTLIFVSFILLISSLCEADNAGLSFELEAASPLLYDHTLGGGNAYDCTEPNLYGFNYACGDRISIFLVVTTSSSFKGTSSSVISLSFTGHPALSIKGISNNCASSSVDNSNLCSNAGSAVASLPKQTGSATDLTVQLTRLSQNSVVVLRLDFILNCASLPSSDETCLSLNSYKIGSGNSNNVGVSIELTGPNDILNCDDNNYCTTEKPAGSYSSRYCQSTSKNCDDSNACTTDSCDSSTGKCSNVPISCDDGVACTTDSCDAKVGCKHTTQNCCDDNACTFDACGSTGCIHTPLVCDDNDPCTEQHCDPAVGCIISAKCCCDSNACTQDYCDTSVGCVNEEISCNDDNACTDDSCDSEIGCIHTVRLYLPVTKLAYLSIATKLDLVTVTMLVFL